MKRPNEWIWNSKKNKFDTGFGTFHGYRNNCLCFKHYCL